MFSFVIPFAEATEVSFGYHPESATSNTVDKSADYIIMSEFTCYYDGNVSVISIGQNGNPSYPLMVTPFIYSSGGELLGYGAEIDISSSDFEYKNSSLVAPVPVYEGLDYWLGYKYDQADYMILTRTFVGTTEQTWYKDLAYGDGIPPESRGTEYTKINFKLAIVAYLDLSPFEYFFGNEENYPENTIGTFYDYDRVFIARFSCYSTSTVNQIGLHLSSLTDNEALARAVIYSDKNGVPDTLLAIGAEQEIQGGSQGSRWYYWDVDVDVTAGSWYWIGCIAVTDETHVLYVHATQYGDNCLYGTITSYPNPPNVLGSLTESENTLAVRAFFEFDTTIVSGADYEGYDVVETDTLYSIRWQEKTFYAQGRYWLFYRDGGDETNTGVTMFTSSPNGDVWDEPTNITNANLAEEHGENIEVLYRDGYIECIYRNLNLYYKRGIPASDGTITWLTDWQVAWEPLASNADFYFTVDSNGYIWISWSIGDPGSGKSYVSKNALTNGTWQTASGYPKKLSDTVTSNNWIMPFDNGDMYFFTFYTGAGTPIYGYYYDYSAGTWGDEEEVTQSSSIVEQYVYGHESWSRSAVIDSHNNIYVAFVSQGYRLICVKRDFKTGTWSGEQAIYPVAGAFSSPALYIQNDYVQCYWIYNYTHVVYKNLLSSGYWSEYPVTVIYEPDSFAINADEDFPTAGWDGRLMSFTVSYGDTIGMFWMAGLSEPYTIKFYPLAPPTPDVSYYPHLETQNDLVFRSGGHTMTVHINTGTLNGTDVVLALSNKGGTFYFNSWTDAEIQFSGDYDFSFTDTGVSFSELIKNREYFGDLPNDGSLVTFQWRWKVLMPHEENFMFYVGLVGLGLVLFGLMITVYTFRHYPIFSMGSREIVWEQDTLIYGVLAVFIGGAIVVLWLLG